MVLNSVELPEDSQKLKRHIALLCDRICKGGSLGGTRKEVGRQSTYMCNMSLWVSCIAVLLHVYVVCRVPILFFLTGNPIT